MEVAWTSETVVTYHKTRRLRSPEDLDFNGNSLWSDQCARWV